MKRLLILAIACIALCTEKTYAASTCPKVYFQAYNMCQTGTVDFSLVICPNDLNQPNVAFDHVDWNFGDGSTVSTSNLSISHAYAVDGAYNATAVVHFTVNGSPCLVTAKYILAPTQPGAPYLDWNGNWWPTNTFVDYCTAPVASLLQNFIPVNIATVNADLWVNPVGPYTVGQAVNIHVDLINLPNGEAMQYHLSIDTLPVATGFYTTSGPQSVVPYTLVDEGFHIVELNLYNPKRPDCPVNRTVVIEVLPVSIICDSCFTFVTKPGKRYWVSAWVKVVNPLVPQVITYDNGSDGNTANVELAFIGSSPLSVKFRPTGDIIEGWQRIAGEFTPPSGTTEVNIKLVNPTGNVAYFDDIRIHPFNASMKSYVNDPETFWLTAELDDNNYATFYEYDKEGKLIRIKKETSRGIVTIKENRSSNPKQN
ncbi:hypothetical protein D3C71_598700 [compost metagenome]